MMMNNNYLDSAKRKTVLIIEDSPIQALALVKLMECEGLNAICASNGLAGISMARFYLPDLIILDVHMPEMDGLEACHVLKQDIKTRQIPVILLTGLDQNLTLLTGVEAGAIDFIPKDAFSDVVLIETMRQLKILPPAQPLLDSESQAVIAVNPKDVWPSGLQTSGLSSSLDGKTKPVCIVSGQEDGENGDGSK